MHVNYFRDRSNKKEDNNSHINNHVPRRFIRRNLLRECSVCGVTSDEILTEWHRGPGNCHLCNPCDLKYQQILAIEDPYKSEIEEFNKQSPMLFIKIIFVMTIGISLSRFREFYITLYQALNNPLGSNDIFLVLDDHNYLKVKDNLFEFLYLRN